MWDSHLFINFSEGLTREVSKFVYDSSPYVAIPITLTTNLTNIKTNYLATSFWNAPQQMHQFREKRFIQNKVDQ